MPPTPEHQRLDAALVTRGLARSRGHAAEIIKAARATVDGQVATKPGQRIADDCVLEVRAEQHDGDVSRAARKLRGVLDELSMVPAGMRCIDVGASTGGFTQVLLDRGAREVVAIDVGTDQLVDRLRTDPRVLSMEGTHVGHLAPGQVAPGDLVVVDVSFISLLPILDQLAELTAPDGTLLPMVKPQFEVGRSGLDKHGVVVDEARRKAAVLAVVEAAQERGLHAVAIRPSRLPGPTGNREYFVRLSRAFARGEPERLWERAGAQIDKLR